MYLSAINNAWSRNCQCKQYKEYGLSAINDSREPIQNCKCLLEFEGKFEKPLDTEKGAWEEPIPEKIIVKILLDFPFTKSALHYCIFKKYSLQLIYKNISDLIL
jgi:hypothetical protein